MSLSSKSMFFRMFVLVAVIAIVNCGDRNDLVSRYIFIIILNKNSSILILKYFDEIKSISWELKSIKSKKRKLFAKTVSLCLMGYLHMRFQSLTLQFDNDYTYKIIKWPAQGSISTSDFRVQFCSLTTMLLTT